MRRRLHEQRDEARLRVRVEEAPEEERARGRRGDPFHGAAATEQDRDEQDRDRDDEIAAVQAGVLEERRDAEERRIGVRDLHVASEEERPRLRLPDPDRGEDGAEGDDGPEERARKPRGERRPRDDAQSGREGEDEERERDRAGALIPGPEVRRRAEDDECHERQRK
jgi:hypothetical protein